MTDRYTEVTRVLNRVLALNLLVAFAKIGLGYYTGAVSIVSDGYHSLTDSASNVVALVGVSIARRPPDEAAPAYRACCYAQRTSGLICDSCWSKTM